MPGPFPTIEEIPADHLRISLGITIKSIAFTYRGKHIGGDDAERIANAIMAHFEQCKWKVMHEPVPWHSSPQHSPPAKE